MTSILMNLAEEATNIDRNQPNILRLELSVSLRASDMFYNEQRRGRRDMSTYM